MPTYHEIASPVPDDYAVRHLAHIPGPYSGSRRRRRLDPAMVEELRDTLAFVRCAIVEHGARLLITRHGSNAAGDRHKVTIQLVYLRGNGALGMLGVTWAITELGWMDAARGSGNRVAIFGGGGTPVVWGTVAHVAHALGIDHDDAYRIAYWEGN